MSAERIHPPQPGFKPEEYIIRGRTESDFVDPEGNRIADLGLLEVQPNDIESQCGVANESQHVEQYDGTLGVTQAFVNARQAPVGQIQWNNNLATIFTNPGNVNGARWCSGTLIGRDLFLTAGHCFDSTPAGGWMVPRINGTTTPIPPADIARNMHVNFNFQRDAAGNLRAEQQFAITQLLEHRLGGLDYAIVRLAGNPGDTFGATLLSRRDGTAGEMSAIIGHPAGLPKQIEAGPITAVTGNQIRYNDTDTLGGNSGSGVLLSADGTIAGVHTNGGCAGTSPETGFNIGQRIGALRDASPIIDGILTGFGNLADGRPIWIGDFTGDGRSDVLFYFSGDQNWWLGAHNGNQLVWSFAGNTAGFGQVWDGRPIWIGDFNGDGRTEVLFYYPGDQNWWLGAYVGSQLVWSLVSNTAGFGQVADGRPIWIGDFNGDGRADVLFYFPGDQNWWLGAYDGNQLVWSFAGNTAGFGDIWDGRPIWIGNFSPQANRAQVLFYYPGDQNWWLGVHDGNQLNWSFAGNTAGFGQVWDGRPFWTGDFNGDGRADVLFFFPGDHNWWLGAHDGNQLTWSFAGNTSGFGQVADGRPIWMGDFSGDGRSDALFYFPGDRNWWLGAYDGSQLAWSFAGNTAGFGQIWDGRPFWIGRFSPQANRAQVLFYFPWDGNWWLGAHDGSQLVWSFAGNTGAP